MLCLKTTALCQVLMMTPGTMDTSRRVHWPLVVLSGCYVSSVHWLSVLPVWAWRRRAQHLVFRFSDRLHARLLLQPDPILYRQRGPPTKGSGLRFGRCNIYLPDLSPKPREMMFGEWKMRSGSSLTTQMPPFETPVESPCKVLIATRVPSLLGGGAVQEVFVCILSEHEAVKLRLSTAGRRP